MAKRSNTTMTGGKSHRQKIWEAIRSQADFFYAHDIEKATGCKMATVYYHLRQYKKAGLLEAKEVPSTPRAGDLPFITYQLIKNVGIEAPIINKQGGIILKAPRFEVLWRTLRILKSVTTAQLISHVEDAGLSISKRSVNIYMNGLLNGGYIKVTGKEGSRVFSLKPNMDTGPRPPCMQKVAVVYDPNLDQIMYSQNPEEQL